MNIGLLGFGVVGGGVWELAQENRALNVKKVLVRREAPSLGKAAVQDVEAILRDTEIDTVVEVLGGLHPAYEWICRALAAGKDVVTANKAVISAYYRELTALARQGYDCRLLVVIQMKGPRLFRPNWATQPTFGRALAQARAAGVGLLAMDCRVTPAVMALDAPVPIDLAAPKGV